MKRRLKSVSHPHALAAHHPLELDVTKIVLRDGVDAGYKYLADVQHTA